MRILADGARRSVAVAMLALLPVAAFPHADVVAIVNRLRVHDCPVHPTNRSSLRTNKRLDRAARLIAEGRTMQTALAQAGYRADESADVILDGVTGNAVLRELLLHNQCQALTDPHLSEIGTATHGRRVAIVLAAPFAPPNVRDAARVAGDVLALVNAARSHKRRCGGKLFDAVAPLTLNPQLHVAALAHARDMAKTGIVEHQGSDGSDPGERATRAGYRWKTVGENIAAGQLSAKEVVANWLASPKHCANIMDPDYAEMAVAYAVNRKQSLGIYWAQEFGHRR